MSLSLGLVEKYNNGFRRIYYLAYPPERSVNAGILEKYFDIKYTTFNDIIRIIKIVGRHTVIFKKNIKNIFRNILITVNN